MDWHPGNFLFRDDGRLGLIDFGVVMHFDEAEWALMGLIDRALTTGDRSDRVTALRAWVDIEDGDTDRMRLLEEWADWCWRSRYCGGEFDFSDEADFRRGIELFLEAARKRYTRARASTPTISRQQFGWRAMLYRLKAKIDVRPIAESEVGAAGWDRSDYTA